MMTTESMPRRHARAGAPLAPPVGLLGRAVLATSALGLVGVVLAGVLDGSAALAGAAAGVALAVVVLALGTLVVAVVAASLPAASLMVALLTYVLQVLVLGLVFLALTGSGLLDGTLDRTWLGVGLVVTTLTWSLAQIRLATTARIPAFDLSSRPADAGAR